MGLHEAVQGQLQSEFEADSWDNVTTTVVGDDNGETSNVIGALLLALFALAINLVLFLPAYYVKRRRLQEQQTRRQAFRASQPSSAIGGDKDDRYRTIESWVVSKQICEHDELCEKVCQLQSLDNKPRLRKQTMSTVDSVDVEGGDDKDEETATSSPSCDENSDDESESKECPICFDTFEVNDIVSWSADPVCRHIFHHRCLKEWLVKNKGCPFCREIFLPVDRTGNNLSFASLSDLIVAQEQRSLHCYYCVDHGIVSLPRDLKDCLDETAFEKISHRAQEVPDRSILSSMRGPTHCIDCDIESGKNELASDTNDDEVVPNATVGGNETTTIILATEEASDDDSTSQNDDA